MSDEPDYEYPPQWARPGQTPPVRKSYKPALRSGLGFTGEEPDDSDGYEEPDDSDGYPPEWRREPKATEP
jgi:hypothetical protein